MAISLDNPSSQGVGSVAPQTPSLSRHALRAAPPVAGGDDGLGAQQRMQERFWNLPNTITVMRAAVVPVLLVFPLFGGGPDGGPSERVSTIFAWFFIVAAVSDLVDGWLARRGQMVTHFGQLLDPLADKLLSSTALIVLLAIGRIEVEATWMVVVIVGRELAVTGLRSLASAGGQIVAANGLGKVKALTQNIAVGALLFHYETLGLSAHAVGMGFLVIATVLTIVSGYAYFAAYFRGLSAAGQGGGKG